MNILMSNKHTVTVVTVYQELVLVCKDVDKWGLRGAKAPQFFDKTNDVVWERPKGVDTKFCWNFKFVEINKLRVMDIVSKMYIKYPLVYMFTCM